MLLRALLTLAALLATAAPAQAAWVWPVDGEVITPYRNGDDPYAAGQHRGIDIAASVGTPVVAAAGSSGLTVSIRTADGAYDTSYLHLSETTVQGGERVGAGDRLGSVGTTGVRSAERPHLHFGVRDAGTKHAYRDPLAFLPPPPAARPGPAPTPEAPLPVTPEPGLAPEPRRAPHRAPRTAPRGAPRAVPRRAPRAVPHRAPRFAPRGEPHIAPRRAPRTAPRDAPAPDVPRPFPAAHRAPLSKPVVREPQGTARAPLSKPVLREPQGAAQAPARPDLGLVLACLGLLAAAAVLGLSEGDRRARGRPTRHRLTALLGLRPGRG